MTGKAAGKVATKAFSRSHARGWVLQALYEVDMTKADPIDALAHVLSTEEATLGREAVDFARSLMTGIMKEREQIDALIDEQSLHWRLERMACVDRNVLRLGVYELLVADAPRKVILNEAIELAKTFGTEGSGPFVNGILDKLSRKLSKGAVE